MMIILEGMDDTGKSTLAAKLSGGLNIPIIKAVPSGGPDQPDQYYKDWVKARFYKHSYYPSSLEIFDRFPLLSEEIYGPVFREGNHFNPMEPWLDNMLLVPHKLIYCRPPRDKVLSTLGTGFQMDGVVKEATRLLDLYDKLMKKLEVLGFDIHVYNYTEPEAYSGVLEFIIRDRRKF